MVATQPMGAFNRDANYLVLTVGDRLVVNHLLEHDFLSDVQPECLLDDLQRMPLLEKAPIFNKYPPMGCAVLGRGAEPPVFWVLLIWLERGISHVTWVHYDATMCLACFVCSILPVVHFLRFGLCGL